MLKQQILTSTISMSSGINKSKNISTAFNFLQSAVDRGATWVLLPEMFPYFGPYENLFQMAEGIGGELFCQLASFAKKNEIYLFAGTVPERPSTESRDGRCYNSLWAFSPLGELLANYKKCHLFNLYNNAGESLYCESDGYLAGNEIVTLDIDGLRVGLAICYDIRFPLMLQMLASQRPLDILVVPAAFTLDTGKDHWELLLRSRAVEYQCYVIAANQTGHHGEGKRSSGHSVIIDPWGQKIADTGESEGVAFGLINRDYIETVRKKIPVNANARLDLKLKN